jgi:hypothetical protein
MARVQEIYGAGGDDEEVRQALGLPGRYRTALSGEALAAGA